MRTARPVFAFLLLASLGCSKRGGGGADVWTDSAIHQASERGRLIVLTETGFPHFEVKDEAGELQGFDVDLAREMAKEAGLKIEFRDKKFTELQGELGRGLGDFLISGMSITGERGLTVSFTHPYFVTRIVPLLAVPRADGVTRLEQLNDPARRVIAKLGTTGEKAARRHLPRAQIDTLEDEGRCALEVAQGRADAWIYDEVQVRDYAADHPKTSRVLDQVIAREPYGIACRKGDVETVAWVNLVLDLFRRDGRLDALYDKHFPADRFPGLPRPN